MKPIGSAALAGVLCMLATACSTVTTRQPLSATPQPVDQEQFEGTWMLDDGVVHIKFATNGVAKIAGVNWEDDAFKLGHAEMVVVEGEGHNYLSLRGQDDGEWSETWLLLGYTFADSGDLVIWPAGVDFFEKAVEEKQLAGDVEKSQHSTNVVLGDSPEKLLEFLNAAGDKMLFNYKEPAVLRRLAEAE